MNQTAGCATELTLESVVAPARIVVGLFGEATSIQYRLLFESLQELYPVDFCHGDEQAGAPLDGAIVFGNGARAALPAGRAGIPVYLAAEPAAKGVKPPTLDIDLGAVGSLVEFLHHQSMEDRELGAVTPVHSEPGDEVVATRGGEALWIQRKAGGRTAEVVAALPPALGPGEYLFQHFMAGRFMRLLPLIVFLRRLTAAADWQCPERAACFVFDDPSLYWTSYGHLDFQKLAEHTGTHNYAAAVATVPLDTVWAKSQGAGDLSRAQFAAVVFCPHGNDHLKHELVNRDAEGSVRTCAQALRRFERLERLDGIATSRVMEAPHGAWAEATLRAARQVDFEGVFVTPELLLRYNPNVVWPRTLGMEMTSLLVGGLPVLPRIKMTRDWKTGVLLAAVLEQPIGLVGHHPDAVNELALLAEFAQVVNSLGPVHWTSPAGMLRRCYKQRREGTAFHLRMQSRRVDFTVPEDATDLWIHRPWIGASEAGEILTVRRGGHEVWRSDEKEAVIGPIAAPAGAGLEIASRPQTPVDYRTAAAPSLRLWPVARKVLMEIRDRALPTRAQKRAARAAADHSQ